MKLKIIMMIVLCVIVSGCQQRIAEEPEPDLSSAAETTSSESLSSSSAISQELSSVSSEATSTLEDPQKQPAESSENKEDVQTSSTDSTENGPSVTAAIESPIQQDNRASKQAPSVQFAENEDRSPTSSIESGHQTTLSVKYEPADYSDKVWSTVDPEIIKQIDACLNDVAKRHYALDVSNVYLSVKFDGMEQTEQYRLWLEFRGENKRALVQYDRSFWSISPESTDMLRIILQDLAPEVRTTAIITLHKENDEILKTTRENRPGILDNIMNAKKEAVGTDLETFSLLYTLQYNYDEVDNIYQIWEDENTGSMVAVDESQKIWTLDEDAKQSIEQCIEVMESDITESAEDLS